MGHVLQGLDGRRIGDLHRRDQRDGRQRLRMKADHVSLELFGE